HPSRGRPRSPAPTTDRPSPVRPRSNNREVSLSARLKLSSVGPTWRTWMILRSIPIATAAILAGFGANASSEVLTEREAADFVHRFCATLVPIVADYDPNTPGIWPPDDPAVIEPVVTPELADLIEDALVRNSAFEAEIGGKGALGDGVPWTSSSDAAGECMAGTISGTPE